MKKIFFILSIISVFSLTSCEEVITVDLDTAAPRLVIDAAIDWEKDSLGSKQVIKLTTTTGFYSNIIPSVSGATVFITNSSNVVFTFNEVVSNTGFYECNNFIPSIGETYSLTVNYAGQTYTATEKLIDVPEISRISQRNDAGLNADEIEVKFYFQDNNLENNSYLTRYLTTVNAFPEFDVFDDRFAQGNEMFGLYTNEKLKAGDTINCALYGISSQYFNYMRILDGIAGTAGGSPFQTTPATIRGNIINETNEANYCLGYFRLCEVVKSEYIVQ